MQKIIFTIISGFILMHVAYSQTVISNQGKPLLNSSDTIQLMNRIDLTVLAIKNDLNSYSKVVKIDDSTGHNYEYVKDKELKAIKMEYYKDQRDGNLKKVDWYFADGKEIYSESVWTDASGNVTDAEKIYINNERLLAWFVKGKRIDNNSLSFKQLAPEAASYGVKLTALAKEVK